MSRIATEQPRAVWCCSTCGAIYHRDFPRCPADGAEVVMAARDPLLDTTVGNYVIERLIGEGGMGRVYLAHHASLPNKRYAFKVLLGDHAASTAMRTRFTREAERASQLEHPNVVKVVDFGQTQHGLLYIVMEYVDGPSLVTLCDELPMAPPRVVQLAREICKGLQYAHDAGIIHRDLKPENVLVAAGPDGPLPRIVDFGLALSIDQRDARLTESGMTMGTPLFAAPEQLLGKVIDHRADLYALGMTMFEMLTGGMTPVPGHAMEVVSAKTTKDTPRLSERVPELAIPADLEEVVARLTRRRPQDRYASAREVIEALDRVQLGRATGWLRSAVVPWAPAAVDREPMRESSARREMVMPHARRTRIAPSDDTVGPGGGGAEARIPTEPIELVSRRWRRGWLIAGAVGICAVALLTGLAIGASRDRPAPVRESVVHAPIASAPPAVAAAAPSTAVAEPDEIDMSPESDASPVKRRPRQRDQRAARPTSYAEPAAPVSDRGAARVAQAPAPLPPAMRRPPARPGRRELVARIDRVDVSGSLPVGAVQRAIERQRAAIDDCIPAVPGTVIAHFTIRETRRAQDVTATGATASTSACVGAAFNDVRTEAAPDIGDVKVTVQIAFVEKT